MMRNAGLFNAGSAGLLALACAVGALGCPNTDPAVFVVASIANPTVTVMKGSLGTSVKGSFSLRLHLGARASGPSKVTLESFSIIDASANSVLDPLKVTTDKPSPIAVAQDSDVLVTGTFDTGTSPVGADVLTKMCAGNVQIRGSILDSLENTATAVSSPAFKASGCP